MIVVVATFGTLLGSEFLQAFLALMIIFVSILAHLLGQPFDATTKAGRLLFRLEFVALTVAFFTFWTGLLFFLRADRPDLMLSDGLFVFLTLFVSFGNVSFLLVSSTIWMRY